MDTVYLETSVIGHLVGRIHLEPVTAGRQAATRAWWPVASQQYRLLISQLVIDECSAGDADAAQERLDAVKSLEILDATEEVDLLADQLISDGAIPASEPRDAFHVAIAAVNS